MSEDQQPFPEWAGERPARPDIPGELASIGSRFAARFIDGILVLIAIALISSVVVVSALRGADRIGRGTTIVLVIAFAAVSALYELPLVALRGQTLGKMAMRIRVVDASGSLPGWTPAAVRWGVPQAANIVGWLPGLGIVSFPLTLLVYLWAIWDDRKQGLHDKAAGTFVVRVPEG